MSICRSGLHCSLAASLLFVKHLNLLASKLLAAAILSAPTAGDNSEKPRAMAGRVNSEGPVSDVRPAANERQNADQMKEKGERGGRLSRNVHRALPLLFYQSRR